ncbi:hypothetical protein OHR68_00670 [Spirillospora sp. NBC_00431]
MTEFPLPPDDDGQPLRAIVLDPDEITVGNAYARLLPIIDRLINEPFDRAVHAAMLSYLGSEAEAAADAFERLVTRGETTLAGRAMEIEAGLDRMAAP